MRLASTTALVALVALASLTAGSAWWTAPSRLPRELPGPPRAAPPTAVVPSVPCVAARALRSSAAVGEERHGASEPSEPLGLGEPAGLRTSAPRALVRVHGHVRRAGRPVADYDLVFVSSGDRAGADGADWDSTDDDGRFEVELPAARYVVLNDDEGPWVTDVIVPAGAPELVLEIHLPRGP